MRTFIFSLLIIFLIGFQGIALAQGPDNGIIEGQVINDTENGGDVSGLQVLLISYLNNEMQATVTTTTNEEGKFQFSNLAVEYIYLISVTYMDVDYYYPVVFSDDSEEYVEVAVCDSTTSDQTIKVMLAHKIIEVKEDSAIVTEMFVLVNEGDKTYVGGDNSVVDGNQGILVFTLPQEATDFKAPETLADDFLLLNESTVTYAVPFPPGESQIVFNYNVPMPEDNELKLPFTINYPTDYLDVMIKSDNVEVTTGQLAPADPVETSTGERYIHFTGNDFPRGDIIEIRVNRLSNNGSSIIIIPVIILAVIVIAAAVYFLRRSKTVKQRQKSINNSEA